MMSDKVSKSAVTVRDSAGVIDLTPSHYLLCRLPPPTLVTALPLGGDWGVPKIFVPPPAPKCQILSEHFFGILFYSMQSKFVPFFLGRVFLVFCALGCVSVTRGVTAVGRRTAERQVAILAPECAGAQSLHTSQLAPPCPPPLPIPPLPLIPRQMVQSR